MHYKNEKLSQLLEPIDEVDDLGIPANLVLDLIYRLLFSEGEVSVSRFSEITGLHAKLLDDLLSRLKLEHLVEISKTGALGRFSYVYRLTEEGMKRARDAMDRSQYIGPAPVTIDDYSKAILWQTRTSNKVNPDQVQHALRELVLPEGFHRRIGPAVNAGSSIFIYGPPGNGKTTIAQAIGELLGGTDPIWLPYALTAGGQIIQVYDPLVHNRVEETEYLATTSSMGREGPQFDRRWGLFKRPAVMAGGELMMDSLELRFEPIAKFYEAPLQLKANGGMFLIDDFGRQQMRPQDLLNRWIVPLENGVDFLRLQSGQSIQIPFRQLIVFSTNLDPADLVDDAFLRRIQMKVEIGGPDEKLFYKIFRIMCDYHDIPFDQQSFVHLLQEWFRKTKRPMQAVHPRDILRTIVSICEYEHTEPRLTPQLIDEACRSYFVDLYSYGDGSGYIG